MLSQIERNEVNPTLAVTYSIAQVFGMSIGELVETPGVSSSLSVIRAEDKAFHYRSDQDCWIRTLSPLHLEKDVEFYEVRLKSHGALRSAAHFQGTREFLTVQSGRVRVESGIDSEEAGKRRFRQLPGGRSTRHCQYRARRGRGVPRGYLSQ